MSSAAHSQAAISESSYNHAGSTQSVSSALTCQLSCNVKAALQTVIFGSHWSAERQFGSSAATFPANSKCQLRCTPFSPAAILQSVCSQPALLHSVTSFAALFELCQSSRSLSAKLYDVSSAAVLLLLHILSGKLSVIDQVMICQLGNSLLPQSVSSAAVQMLSCSTVSFAQLLFDGSVATRQRSFWSSGNLSAELQPVSSGRQKQQLHRHVRMLEIQPKVP